MDFKSIANSLQVAQGRTNSIQSEIRPLWLDKYGQNFVELVLGDLQDDIKSITGTTDEAANQQMKNIQSRQLNHDYIAAAMGRDAAQQNANQQLDGEISALISNAQSTLPQADGIIQECEKLSYEIGLLRQKMDDAMNGVARDYTI